MRKTLFGLLAGLMMVSSAYSGVNFDQGGSLYRVIRQRKSGKRGSSLPEPVERGGPCVSPSSACRRCWCVGCWSSSARWSADFPPA